MQIGHHSKIMKTWTDPLFSPKAGFAAAMMTKAGLGKMIFLAKAATHGIVQGGMAELQGGDFKDGFLAGATGSLAGTAMNNYGSSIGHFVYG